MSKLSWTTQKVKIEDLEPYENNPRTITHEDMQKLVSSIKEDGYHQRIICTKDFKVLGGHQRIKALQEAGYKASDEIEVLVPNRKLSKTEFERINIRDNIQAGQWDLEALNNWFERDELIDWGLPEHFFPKETEEAEESSGGGVEKTYRIEIECRDEMEQEDLLSRFESEGLKYKAL